jgi:hypothetical protein
MFSPAFDRILIGLFGLVDIAFAASLPLNSEFEFFY